MVSSMTGFGRAEQLIDDKTYLVEIKSLNGKQLDINLKIPPLLKAYELDIRNMLQENLLRGTIEIQMTQKDLQLYTNRIWEKTKRKQTFYYHYYKICKIIFDLSIVKSEWLLYF